MVFLCFLPEEFFKLLDLLRVLGRHIVELGPVLAEVIELPGRQPGILWNDAESLLVGEDGFTTFTRAILPRPNLSTGRSVFTYSGKVTGTPNG
ncbi:MAG: hypothetical protein P8Y83_10660, partial [Gammaproteobacteria bacterium]